MATWINWSVVQGNGCVLSGQVTDEDGNPIDLTNYTLQFVIKPAETSPDSAGTTYTPTITTPKLGKWQLVIAGTAFGTPAASWYRLDVVDGGLNRVTSVLGTTSVFAA